MLKWRREQNLGLFSPLRRRISKLLVSTDLGKIVLCVTVCLVVGRAFSQTSAKPADGKVDYSKEAFVVEQVTSSLIFQNDGTGTRETVSRVRIQSDAGVQRYGILTFPYENANQTLAVEYVKVVKPDGSVVSTPLQSIQDIPSQVSRQAPFYTDLREKDVAVRGLSAGDVLEYAEQWRTIKPLVPGQFWFAYNFGDDLISLREEVRISIPRGRAVKWKSTESKPEIIEEGDRRVFTWVHSHRQRSSADEEKKSQEEKLQQLARGKLPAADIEISSFQSWEEVGSWYRSLQQERVKPSLEVRAEALELIKTASNDNDRIRAIYSYVSTRIRYIGIAFGIGRYQSHAAAEVLANQYGDCKDKHTLLASLLEAAGIRAYPALISGVQDIDPEVPSPGQFDHVITVIPQGSSMLWLDATPEVAPFGYLLSSLRGKNALVIPTDRAASLTLTPLGSPTAAVQTFRIDATLSDQGALEGKIQRTASGDDAEVGLRKAFRQVPSPQWNDLVQRISYAGGFSGDIREVTASPPENLDQRFSFSYLYTRKDFPDWSNRNIATPLPPLALPRYDTKPSNPLWLGPPEEFHYESHVQLPKGYAPELPAKLDLKADFAEYHASYSLKEGVLSTDRRLLVKLSEVPPAEYDIYNEFAKAVSDDHDRHVTLSSGKLPAGASSYQNEIWELPYSENPEAARAYDDAREAYKNHDLQDEIASLKHALGADPKFTRAWLWLGEIYKAARQFDLALQAYRKAIEVDPQQLVSYKALGYTLAGLRRYEEALPIWQKLIMVSPDNLQGLSALSQTLFRLQRYSESAAAMESALKVAPDRADLYAQLGFAYMYEGYESKAEEVFKKAVGLDPRPVMVNNLAYSMADAGKNLPLSLQYAQQAVREEEEASTKNALSDLQVEDLAHTAALAAYWDTLGWVYFRMGNLNQAANYLNAGWILSQDPVIADHLGQLYEQERKRDAALHMYRLALSATPASLRDSMKETRRRIEHLGGQADAPLLQEGQELSEMRTVRLARFAPSGTAEFLFSFVPDAKAPGFQIEAAKFISGSDNLKSADRMLTPGNLRVLFPDLQPTRLLRRALVYCDPYAGCSLVLLNPSDVHSVN